MISAFSLVTSCTIFIPATLEVEGCNSTVSTKNV